MTAYIIRRVLYGLLILVTVNILLFMVFFQVHPPRAMAVRHLGEKYATDEAVENWLSEKGYDLPVFYNGDKAFPESLTRTLFWQKSIYLFALDFGISDATEDPISDEILERIPPSLCIAVPSFVLGLFLAIVISMLVAFYRGSYLDGAALVISVFLMSIPSMIYVVIFQYVFGNVLRVTPTSGFARTFPDVLRFIALPVSVIVISGIGGSVRYYRTVFMEEVNRDYIRTARSKGLGEGKVLFKHALRNAILPILTSVVAQLPFLIMGSMLVERFFGIPGLGNYLIDAIGRNDFAVIRAIVFLGTALYIVALILVDISYCVADPRIRVGGKEHGS
ncbi:MAG: ABC transporter permease [Kiritimatiellia bacterium]